MKSKVCGGSRVSRNEDSPGMCLAAQGCSSPAGTGLEEQQGWLRLIQQLLPSPPGQCLGEQHPIIKLLPAVSFDGAGGPCSPVHPSLPLMSFRAAHQKQASGSNADFTLHK